MRPTIARNINRASMLCITLAIFTIDVVFLRASRATLITIAIVALGCMQATWLVLFGRWLRHQRGI